MTKTNKLIVGGVLVALVGYYLYDRNKKMQEVARLKAGAEAEAVSEALSMKPVNTKAVKSVLDTGRAVDLRADSIGVQQGLPKFSE
jgi:hypothetical protein